MRRITFRDFRNVLLLALVYFGSARLGLKLDAVAGVATPIWPPSGIALAAAFFLGYRIWPGIALGAFFANFTVGQPWYVALAIAFGNTIEPLFAAFLLKETGFRASLRRLRDVMLLIFLAGMGSTILSAMAGVWTVWAAGNLPSSALASAWWTWWCGDLLSDLVLAPVILTWWQLPRRPVLLRRVPEFFLLFAALTAASQMAFGVWSVWWQTPYPLVYLIFPFLVWVAMRFNPRVASFVVLWVASLAIWHTTEGVGPFRFSTLHESLVALQIFLGILSTTSLVLSALFTERRKAERETRRHIADLQRLNQLKSEFASIVAHELKTPLTVIREGIGLVLDGVDGEINEPQAETLNMARDNVDRLSRLIGNVLNYEKLESGKLTLDVEPTDLCALFREVFNFMELIARKKNISVVQEIPEEPLTVVCDPDRIKEVLINLLDNAIKHSYAGETVEVRLENPPGKVHFEVEDSGHGIPIGEQSNIFAMFRQAPSEGRVRIPGSGIGLAVCKQLVELHHGKIWVESSPGRGAKFSVELPLKGALTE